MIRIPLIAVPILALTLAAGAQEQSQSSTTAPHVESPKTDPLAPIFEVGAGFEYRFETPIDGGGEVQLNRYVFQAAFAKPLNEHTRVGFGVSFRNDDYNFRGVTGLGSADPWGDIHTLTGALTLTNRVSNDWTVYGGGIFKASWENGTDFNDAIMGGGFVGARVQIDKRLALGVGIGAISQIEDTERFFPAISVDWQITDNLRFTTNAASARGRLLQGLYGGLGSGGGAELVYDFRNGWEAAIGGSYETNRFRLDDDGIAADGVAEMKSFPIWLRLSYLDLHATEFHLFAGVFTEGQLELDDANGDSITEKDFDDDLALGVSVQFKF